MTIDQNKTEGQTMGEIIIMVAALVFPLFLAIGASMMIKSHSRAEDEHD